MARAFGGCLLVLLSGCSASGDTSILVEISLAAGAPQPTALLTARVYDDSHALTPSRALPSSGLPGRLVVSHLPATAQRIRVIVGGGSVLGVAVVQTIPGQQAKGLLVLGTPADRDGDGVPDSVDVCPNVPDPDQLDDDKDGVGNACGGVILDLSSLADLSSADLSGPPTPCNMHPEYLFCDDFESGALGKWQATGNATITTNALDGTSSALLSVPAGDVGAALNTATPFPTLSGDFWGRVRMELSGSPPGYFSIFSIYDSSGIPGMVFGINSGFISNDEYGFTTNAHTVSGTAINTNTPYCVEWHVGGGTVQVFVDGTEVTALKLTGHEAFTPGKLSVTTALTAAAAASFSCRFDDIVFDDLRIGCGP